MAAPLHSGHAARQHAGGQGHAGHGHAGHGHAGHGHAGHGHKGKGHKGNGHKGNGRRFNLTGLVTAVNGTDLQVLVGKGRLGGKQLAKQSVTVALSSHRGHSATPAVGDTFHAQGSADPVTGQLDATTFEVAIPAVSAMTGVIDAISGTIIYVNVSATAGSGGAGNVRRSATAQDQGGDGADVAVDVSSASISLDGNPGTLSSLATGDTVAILGETDDQSALAAQVLGYSTAPGVVAGSLTQVTGNILTLSTGGDGESGTAAADVTSSQIILDGQPASLSQLTPGDEVLAVGTAGSDPLAATTTFAFDGGDGQGD